MDRRWRGNRCVFTISAAYRPRPTDPATMAAVKALIDRIPSVLKFYSKSSSLDVDRCSALEDLKKKLVIIGVAVTALSAKKPTFTAVDAAFVSLTKHSIEIPNHYLRASLKLNVNERFLKLDWPGVVSVLTDAANHTSVDTVIGPPWRVFVAEL